MVMPLLEARLNKNYKKNYLMQCIFMSKLAFMTCLLLQLNYYFIKF